MRHLSLTQRIKAAYIVSFVFLSLLSTILLFAASKQIEDHIFEKQLLIEIEHFQQRLLQGQQAELPPSITKYNAIADVPVDLRVFIKETTPGVYELAHPDDVDFHYAIVQEQNGQQQIFLYDVNDVELSEALERKITKFIAIGFLVLLLCFFAIFHWVVKRALAPMYQLIEQVKIRQSEPERPIELKLPNDNELGLLNATLADYSKRIEAFVRREREFTSFASHELRTPVTVIKGATTLLKLTPDVSDKCQKPISRIERSVQSMEDMIEMLLSLSREQQSLASDVVELQDVLHTVILNLQDKAQSANASITLCVEEDGHQQVEKIPAELVLTNLLRNAIQHGEVGEISVTLKQGKVSFLNNLPTSLNSTKTFGIRSRERGFGLGTVIVERICQSQDWQYQTDLSAGKYLATVTFAKEQA